MNVTITPALLTGTVAAIPSKSDAHRLLICAALADQPTTLVLPQSSADLDATSACLQALGAGVERCGSSVTVTPIVRVPEAPLLDCGESGSTLRFLLPVAAAIAEDARLTGQGRLPDRPIGDLKAALESRGVVFSTPKLPFSLSGHLHGGEFTLPGNVSSQYITGLLLALPLLKEDSVLRLTTPLESSAYVDITLQVLHRFGITVQKEESGYRIPGRQTFRSPGTVHVDGDWSNGAFFLTAGAIGAPLTVNGLNTASPQGDRAILELLRQFDARVAVSANSAQVRPAPLHGCTVDVSEIPDLLPILAVAAACAGGETRFTGAARLRLKESDRLASVAAMLTALGGTVRELPDGLIVRGGTLTGGTVDSANDHRIVMAAAIAAIRCTGLVTILGAEAVNKSYPSFFEVYLQTGGNVHVL